MRIKFYCSTTESGNGLHTSIWRNAIIKQKGGELFNKYLLSSLGTDLPSYSTRHVDSVLAQVAKVESCVLDAYQYEGDGFVHHITRQRVRFEHSIFGECPEWPVWCCTLAQYKAALQGYRRFLDMPESIESELIIELPDGEPENC